MADTSIQAAALRLRRADEFEDPGQFVEVVYRDKHYGPYDDQCLLANAMELELDPTPVDGEWLLSICEQEADDPSGEPHYFMSGYHTGAVQIIVSPAKDGFDLRVDPYIWPNTTRGEVIRVCHIFGVEIQQKADTAQ